MFVSQGLAVICNKWLPPHVFVRLLMLVVGCVDHRRFIAVAGDESTGPVSPPRTSGNTRVDETMYDIKYHSIYKY